jgi:hypothetical protein
MTAKKERPYGVVDSKYGKIAGNMPCGIARTKGNGDKGTRVGPNEPRKDKP